MACTCAVPGTRVISFQRVGALVKICSSVGSLGPFWRGRPGGLGWRGGAGAAPAGDHTPSVRERLKPFTHRLGGGAHHAQLALRPPVSHQPHGLACTGHPCLRRRPHG
jgi:hypothetical protein